MKGLCYLHIGTHKTGTTSVQKMLTANEPNFLAAGIAVPRAGRTDAWSGHHNIAWELNDDVRFDPRRGTLADVLEEIARAGMPRVCLSSEDFEYLHVRPDALRRIADGLEEIGYRALVVVYLRPQAGYVESLYAELVKHGLADTFDDFLTEVITKGEFRYRDRWRFTVDYERLTDNFAAVFGAPKIVTRRYETAGKFGVVDDFLNLIGMRPSDLDPRSLHSGTRLNAARPFGEVLHTLEENVLSRGRVPGARVSGMRTVGGRFDPVHLGEARRIIDRFNAGNRRVYEQYGTLIPCVSGRDLVGDIAAEIGLNPGSRARQRLIAAIAPTYAGTPASISAPSSGDRPGSHPGGVVRADWLGAAIGDIKRRLCSPNFARAAALQVVLFVTAAAVAISSIAYGQPTGSTALVEFGLLSGVVAASAMVMAARYALESLGIITDGPFFTSCCARLQVIGYAGVGLYALVNAVLDVRVPRYDPDWVSYPGLTVAAMATLIVAVVLPTKRRLLDGAAPGAIDEHLIDDRWYLACGYITLLGLSCHALTPAWWLDTTIDVIFVALVALHIYGRRSPTRVRSMPAMS